MNFMIGLGSIIIIYLLHIIIFIFQKKGKLTYINLVINLLITFFVFGIFYIVLIFIVEFDTIGNNIILGSTLAIIGLLIRIENYINFNFYKEETRINNLVLGIILFCLLLAEIFFFNSLAIESKLINMEKNIAYETSQFTLENAILFDEKIIIGDNTKVIIDNDNKRTHNIYVKIIAPEKIYTIQIETKGSSNDFYQTYNELYQKKNYNPFVDSSMLYLTNTNENIDTICISFDNNSNGNIIDEIIINKTIDLQFNIFRILILIILFFLIYLLFRYSLYNIFKDEREEKKFPVDPLIFLFMTCCLVGFIIFSVINKEKYFMEYPFIINEHLGVSYSYALQFDAFMNKQLFINFLPSTELLALENPYDVVQRSGIFYLWDRALYDGKYYIYYGVLPVFLIYYPTYYISNETLIPNLIFIQQMFFIIAFFFSILATKEVIRFTCQKIRIYFYYLSLCLAAISSGFLLSFLAEDHIYNVPITIGIACFYAFIYFVFKAYNSNKIALKTVLLFFGAMSYIFILTARPNLAIAGLIVIPILLMMFFNKKNSIRNTLIMFTPFAIMMILGFGWIFYYNFMRFDSILEFGMKYQLTVNDISQNTFRIGKIPLAAFHYLIHPPEPHIIFPYFTPTKIDLNIYGDYIYSDRNMGILFIPIFWTIVFLFVAIKKENKLYKSVIFLLVLTICLMCIVSYVNAGINYRYTLDFYPIALLLSIIIMMKIVEKKVLLKKWAIIYTCLFVLTGFVIINLLAYNDLTYIFESYPRFTFIMRDFFGYIIK